MRSLGCPIRCFLVFLAVQLSYRNVTAQEVDHQLWTNYAVSVPVNEKFSYGGDAGIRGLVSNYDWNQVLIRPNVSYRFNYTFSVSPAMAWFGTFNNNASNVNEFRLHQDFNAKWPDLGPVEFFYRIRIEQRWFFYENPDLDNTFNWRFRGLIGMETEDIKVFGPKRPIYFQLIYEGFSTADRSAPEIFVNQTRFHMAMGHRLSNKFRYELHYIRQGSRLLADDGIDVSTNIYRLRLFHRIIPKEQE